MIMINWSSNVNTNFYAFNDRPKENVTLVDNLSGRKVGCRNNTKDIMQISCSLRLSLAELRDFWNWFNNDLAQMAGAFYCEPLATAIGASATQLFRFNSIPEPQDTDQTHRELSLDIEEVF